MLDLIEVILKEPIFGTRKMRELSSYCGASSAVYSSEIDIIETKNGDEWDSWDNYNITEFVDDDHDPAGVAQFVTDTNGYTNYSPTKPKDGAQISCPYQSKNIFFTKRYNVFNTPKLCKLLQTATVQNRQLQRRKQSSRKSESQTSRN